MHVKFDNVQKRELSFEAGRVVDEVICGLSASTYILTHFRFTTGKEKPPTEYCTGVGNIRGW